MFVFLTFNRVSDIGYLLNKYLREKGNNYRIHSGIREYYNLTGIKDS